MSIDTALLTARDFQTTPDTYCGALAALRTWQEEGRLDATFGILGGIIGSPLPAGPGQHDGQEALTPIFQMVAYVAEAPLESVWLPQRGILIAAALARQCRLVCQENIEPPGPEGPEEDDDGGTSELSVLPELIDRFCERVGFASTDVWYFDRLTRGNLNIPQLQAVEDNWQHRWSIYRDPDWPLYRLLLYADCRARGDAGQHDWEWLAEDERKWAADEAVRIERRRKHERLYDTYELASKLVCLLGPMIALVLGAAIGHWLCRGWVGVLTGAGMCLLSWLVPVIFIGLSKEVESAGHRHLERLNSEACPQGRNRDDDYYDDDDSVEVMCLNK